MESHALHHHYALEKSEPRAPKVSVLLAVVTTTGSQVSLAEPSYRWRGASNPQAQRLLQELELQGLA